MQVVTDQFPGCMVIVRSAGLARYVSFELSVEGLQVPLNTHITRAISANLAGTLNDIVRDNKTPYYWFIDDDHTFDVFHLLRLMSHDLPVVNGVTCMNKPPFHAVIFQAEIEWDEEVFPKNLDEITAEIVGNRLPEVEVIERIKGLMRSREYKPKKKKYLTFPWKQLDDKAGLMPVHACGLAGLLVKREVFDKIAYPWFELGQTNSQEVGEDVWFCQKLREHGYAPIIDLDLVFGHTAPATAWPVRREDGRWTIRLNWENGQNIVINRPDSENETSVIEAGKLAQVGDKGQRIIERQKELIAGGLSPSEAFSTAMREANA